MAEAEAIDLFLHAAAVGLFAMDWLLLCPLCSCVVGSFGSLRVVDNHYHCSMCQTDYEAKLDDYIAVTFTVSPAIRRIAFHDPAGLPARDYVVKYRVTGAHLAGRTPDGLIWGDLVDQLTRVVSYMAPAETVRHELTAQGGFLLGYDTDSDAGFVIAIAGEPTEELQTVRLEYQDGRCEPARGKVRPGPVVIEITNATPRRGLIGVAELPADFARCQLTYEPFLTGARVLTTQTFRDLFRAEVIRGTEGIGVTDITLLFTDLKGSTALYEWIGDLNALALGAAALRATARRHRPARGTIIKTIGDAVMSAFQDPADAVRAALAMMAGVEVLNVDIGERDRPQDRDPQRRRDRGDPQRPARLLRPDRERGGAGAGSRRRRRDLPHARGARRPRRGRAADIPNRQVGVRAAEGTGAGDGGVTGQGAAAAGLSH